MYTNNSTKQVIEKYISLPGGSMLTIRPTASTNATKIKLSIRNLHGDTMSVINGDGVNETGILVYEPFGTQITATSGFTGIVLGAAVSPANAQGSQSFGWAGAARRSNETNFVLMPVQMGARLYIPVLGRFIQADPIDGGTENSYVYPTNPLSSSDYSGMLSVQPIPYQRLVLAPPPPPRTVVVVSASSYATWGGLTVSTVLRQAPTPPAPSPAPTQSYVPPKIATVNGYNITDIKSAPKDSWKQTYTPSANIKQFNAVGAATTAYDWYYWGALAGGIAGCAVGALITAGAAAAACMVYGAAATAGGGLIGAGSGFYAGGTDSVYADDLDLGPFSPGNPWSSR